MINYKNPSERLIIITLIILISTIMLEFGKTILEKVSFDALLFKKELRKLKKWMSEREIGSFEEWCKERFGKMYPKIISDCFKRKTDTESL